MKIPYGVDLSVLGNPEWKPVPDGYIITYQPHGNGHTYFAWNEKIDRSCRHFSRMVNSAFVAKEYETYNEAHAAIIEHSQGCTKAFFPDSKMNIIILPAMEV